MVGPGVRDDVLILRVATRFASSLVTKDWVDSHLRRPGLSPLMVTKLKALSNLLDFGGIDPFPISEFVEYMTSRSVSEEEAEALLAMKVRAPKQRTVSWSDAYIAMSREAGKSVIFDGSLESEPDAAVVVMAWVKGLKALKPKARAIFDRVVRKVALRSPRGSEDASWNSGSVLALSVSKRALSPASMTSFITHELGHGVEEHENVRGAPWGEPPFISEYAESKPHVEDFAESFRVYVEKPADLKRLAPSKFEAMKRLIG